MDLLLDACVWAGAAPAIEAAGRGVIFANRGEADDEILARAYAAGRVLVTLDRDFGELAVAKRQPHTGIVRLVNFRAQQQARACLRTLELHGNELLAGAIVTTEPGRIRIRPPENIA